jgi:hypothetical protein
MSTPQYGPDRARNRLGENDAAQCAERDATTAAQRTEREAATAAARSAREQESDAYREQAHHWRPNRLPRP